MTTKKSSKESLWLYDTVSDWGDLIDLVRKGKWNKKYGWIECEIRGSNEER